MLGKPVAASRDVKVRELDVGECRGAKPRESSRASAARDAVICVG